MLLKKYEILDLHKAISALKDVKVGNIKFLYALTKNFKTLIPEVEAINEAMRLDQDLQEFERERVSLIMKYARRDESGNVMWAVPNQLPLMNETPEALEELNGFAQSHSEELKALEDFHKRVEEFLNEETEVQLDKIYIGLIPEGSVDFEVMNVLYPILED